MRAPLLFLVLLLAVVATVSLVPAVCNGEEAGTSGEEHGGSVNPMSYSLAVEDDESEEKARKKAMEHNQDEQGKARMTAETYVQNPVQQQAASAGASTADEQPNQYVASLDPEQKVKEAKSDESVEESAYAKKEKKIKKEEKEISDYLDESTSSKKEKKVKKEKMVKSDDSADKKEQNDKWEYLDVSATSFKKKKKKAKTDDDVDEDAALTKKEKKEKSAASGKKHKKKKSVDDDSESTSPKKAKKEKSIDSDATSSAYLNKKEKESVDSDEATHLKKQKKHKKKKKKKHHEEENPDEDAAPADVSTDGKYVSSTKDEEKPDSDATPVDVSTTTGQYVSSKADVELNKGGERQISNNAVPFASPNQDASSQPMAAGYPDELPPAAKSSATPGAYVAPKQPVVSSSSQPMAAGSPDELPPAAKKPATFDPYASSKQQVFSSQPMASGAPDEFPPQAKSAEPGKPILSVGAISGMIRKPIAQFLTPVIKSVCAKATFPEDCEWSITTLPGAASAAATDSMGVLKLAMEAVREKVVVAMNAATDRMHAPGVDATTKEALDSCTSSYSDIKAALDTANDALKSGDVDTATTNLDAVETDLNTCDDGFTERYTPSVMTDHDQELVKLASNLLSINKELKKQ